MADEGGLNVVEYVEREDVNDNEENGSFSSLRTCYPSDGV